MVLESVGGVLFAKRSKFVEVHLEIMCHLLGLGGGQPHGDSVKCFSCGGISLTISSKTIDLPEGPLLHAPVQDLHHLDDLSKEQAGPRPDRSG